jgi:hypothetical protein
LSCGVQGLADFEKKNRLEAKKKRSAVKQQRRNKGSYDD